MLSTVAPKSLRGRGQAGDHPAPGPLRCVDFRRIPGTFVRHVDAVNAGIETGGLPDAHTPPEMAAINDLFDKAREDLRYALENKLHDL